MAERISARQSDARRKAVRAALAGLLACATPVMRAEPLQVRRHAPMAFDRLTIEVPADVRISFADRFEVRIEAEPKVVDGIAFNVQGATLRVTAAKSFQTRQPIAIEITCRGLSTLEARASADVTLTAMTGIAFDLVATGAANVAMEHLNLSSLGVDIGGSATVTANGVVKAQSIRSAGSATYDARRLVSQSARVDASDSSDVVVDSRASLDVAISGAATVQYAGNPKLNQAIEDAGTLEQL
jgi:hypothetical protein